MLVSLLVILKMPKANFATPKYSMVIYLPLHLKAGIRIRSKRQKWLMCTLRVINHYHTVETLNDKLLGPEMNLSNERLSPPKGQTAQKHTLEKQTFPHVTFFFN